MSTNPVSIIPLATARLAGPETEDAPYHSIRGFRIRSSRAVAASNARRFPTAHITAVVIRTPAEAKR
jgi:hypothetical protein